MDRWRRFRLLALTRSDGRCRGGPAVRHPNGQQPFELWKRTTPRAHVGAAPQTKAKLSVDFQYRPPLSCRIAPESLNLPVIEQLWRAELRSPATSRRAWRRRCHPSTSRRRTARIQPSSYAAACRSGDSTMVAIRTSWMRTTQPERTLALRDGYQPRAAAPQASRPSSPRTIKYDGIRRVTGRSR